MFIYMITYISFEYFDRVIPIWGSILYRCIIHITIIYYNLYNFKLGKDGKIAKPSGKAPPDPYVKGNNLHYLKRKLFIIIISHAEIVVHVELCTIVHAL